MLKINEKQAMLVVYALSTVVAMILMLYLPRLGYDIRKDFIFIALVLFSAAFGVYLIGMAILVKFRILKL
ncbi:hypothetical protein [Methanofervidicoccus sp. A16]|uniref:hypothetical protein n=1 Tax=Methanofervidicoccus sp. A16 TaxID=2607662 RepID=UPI0012375873|nr:hypothetical protein [Methanofervidicoccus sp. A16]